jgi:hypothetical protein
VQRWAGRLACAACALLLVSGCGDSGSPATSGVRGTAAAATAPLPRAPDDPARARIGLVRRADIPAEVGEQDGGLDYPECSPRALFKHRASGIATTPRYQTAETSVQQSVLLFRDAAAAAAAFKRLDSPANRRCIERYVHTVATHRAQTPVASLTRQALLVEPVGEQSSSYRLEVPVPDYEAAVDILINRIGRALSSASLVWDVPSRDLELQEALVARFATHVRQALALG